MLGQGRLDVVDDRERGGVGPLGHQDVDGPAAVDQGVAGGDVAGVLHGRHVADVDGRVLRRAGSGSSPAPGPAGPAS